jgi:hypothetical protein
MKEFRKPDLNAPRYRAQRAEILNSEFYKEFRESFPKYSYLTDQDIRNIVNSVNGKIWETVIQERNGVELPEQLGYVFIGSCPAPKKQNPNYYISKQLEKVIQHRNWESDQYLAKIFYTNAASKYRFQFSSLWGLSPVRQFSRTVAKTYPENWNMYVVVDPTAKLRLIYQKATYIDMLVKKQKKELKTYNEFDI